MMQLVFDIVKNGKNIPKKRNFRFDESGGTIGRREENDWVLTDPNSYISGTHARILCKQGTYFIKDESTNGTFLKNPYKKLPKGHPVKINASDVFIIGDHELQARFSNNDFAEDDIVSSFESQSEAPGIIPNDDFLFETSSSDFVSIKSEEPSDADILGVLHENDPMESFSVQQEPEGIDAIIPPLGEEFDFGVEDMGKSVQEPAEATLEACIEVPTYTQPAPKKSEPQGAVKMQAPADTHGLVASIAVLEQKLGISIAALPQEERDALMAKIGDIITTTFDSLQNSLQIQEKTKQDLYLSTNYLEANDDNPMRLGASATKLLQNDQADTMLGMMQLPEAVRSSFAQIDAHAIALHGASRRLFRIALEKFAPKNLEYRFEAAGSLRGVLPRQQLLWKAYSEMFAYLNEHPQEGEEMLRDEFKKEYENLAFSLKLQSPQTRKKL